MSNLGTKYRVLITGGSRGIGLATATSLYDCGYDVTVVGRSGCSKFLNPSIKYITADLSTQTGVSYVCDYIQSNPIYGLINNLGVDENKPFEQLALDEFSNVMNTNVYSHFQLCKKSIPGMISMSGGRIVFITSIWGESSIHHRQAYSCSKFALHGLSQSLADEYAEKNIHVNCVAPGFIDIDKTTDSSSSYYRGIFRKKKLSEQIPMKRLGTPPEVANLIKWLISSDCTYITGQTITIDGGFSTGRKRDL